jgi:predicted dehydrogenase
LVGAGAMALCYARVLQALGVEFDVVGRGAATAAAFEGQTGVRPMLGGVAAAIARGEVHHQRAIVAVSVDQLAPVSRILIERDVRRILVEKPAGLDPIEISALADSAARAGADVHVAYNRRFYVSTQTARKIIEADRGATSLLFEFTEWAHEIATHPASAAIKRQWFLANSTHVCDLAFFLCGPPATLSATVGGKLDWHPAGAQFVGSGRTARGALFAYHSNWESAGRWGIEVCTRERRIHLRPLEGLFEQRRGELQLKPVPLDDELDRIFKPGLYRQTRAFLGGPGSNDLLSIADHAKAVREIYAAMVPDAEAGSIGCRAES